MPAAGAGRRVRAGPGRALTYDRRRHGGCHQSEEKQRSGRSAHGAGSGSACETTLAATGILPRAPRLSASGRGAPPVSRRTGGSCLGHGGLGRLRAIDCASGRCRQPIEGVDGVRSATGCLDLAAPGESCFAVDGTPRLARRSRPVSPPHRRVSQFACRSRSRSRPPMALRALAASPRPTA